MAGMWHMVAAAELCQGDLVRGARSYPGEEYEIASGEAWADGMPEAVERWYVADVTRNGWITLVQQRRPDLGRDVLGKQRWGGVFEDTGTTLKHRARAARFLVALSPAGGDERWKRFGLVQREPLSPQERTPAR